MPFETINQGVLIQIPTNGTENYASSLKENAWKALSSHDHTTNKGQAIPAGGIASEAVTSAKLAKNIGFKQYASTLTPAGTTQTIDFNNGMIQKLDLGAASGDVTLTLSNPTEGAIYKIFVIQGATIRDIIYPASVKWPQGQKPILSQVEDYIDIINLYYDGTNYYGDWNISYA